MRLIVIPIQSVNDVITNSSSELFVCDTNKTVDIVKDIIFKDNIVGVCDPVKFSYKDYIQWKQSDNNNDYTSVYYYVQGWFPDETASDEEWNSLLHYQLSEIDRMWYMMKFEEECKSYIANKLGKSIYDINLFAPSKEVLKYGKEWIKDNWDRLPDSITKMETVQSLDGKILILSSDDNSVSLENMDKIYEDFNAYSIHLG